MQPAVITQQGFLVHNYTGVKSLSLVESDLPKQNSLLWQKARLWRRKHFPLKLHDLFTSKSIFMGLFGALGASNPPQPSATVLSSLLQWMEDQQILSLTL